MRLGVCVTWILTFVFSGWITSSCSDRNPLVSRTNNNEASEQEQQAQVALTEIDFLVERLEGNLFSDHAARAKAAERNVPSFYGKADSLGSLLNLSARQQSALVDTEQHYDMKKIEGADTYVFALRHCDSETCRCLTPAVESIACKHALDKIDQEPLKAKTSAAELKRSGAGKFKIAAYAIAADSKTKTVIAGAKFFLRADGSLTGIEDQLAQVKLNIFGVPTNMRFDLDADFDFSVTPQSKDITIDGYGGVIVKSLCNSGGCIEEEILTFQAAADGLFSIKKSVFDQAQFVAGEYELRIFALANDANGESVRSPTANLVETVTFFVDVKKYLSELVLELNEAPQGLAFRLNEVMKFKVDVLASTRDLAIDAFKVSFFEENCTSSGCHDEPLFEMGLGSEGQFELATTHQDFKLFEAGEYKMKIWAEVLDDSATIQRSDLPNLEAKITFKACTEGGQQLNDACYYLGEEKGLANSVSSSEGESCQDLCGRLSLSFDLEATQAISVKANMNLCLEAAKLFLPSLTTVYGIDTPNVSSKAGCGILSDNAVTISGGAEAVVSKILSSTSASDVDAETKPRAVGHSRICSCR